MLPSDLTTTSFGLFSRLPWYLSARATIAPSGSVRETRLLPCSQAINLSCLSRVNPLEFPLGERARVGRESENDICLQGRLLSRYHALFERTPEGLRITDLGSTNGTWVNGQRISGPVTLKGDELIAIGEAQCTVRAD